MENIEHELMKNIPANAWLNLTEDDWNFLQIEKTTFKNEEWPQCLLRELYREKIQAEAGGTFPEKQIAFASKANRRKFLVGDKPAETYVNADWTSYLARRKSEKWKRLPKAEKRDASSWLAMDWHNFFRHYGEAAEYNATHVPPTSIMDDQKTEIVPMRIPWDWRDDEITAAFAQWLKNNRPKGESGFIHFPWGEKMFVGDDRPAIPEPPAQPKGKSGAGSYIRQVKTLLKQLAAWRLIQRHKGNHVKAYSHPGALKYLGQAYNHPGEWTDARKAVQEALKKYWRIHRDAEIFASTKSD